MKTQTKTLWLIGLVAMTLLFAACNKQPEPATLETLTIEPDKYEPNDTLGMAHELTLKYSSERFSSVILDASIHNTTDVDYYKFPFDGTSAVFVAHGPVYFGMELVSGCGYLAEKEFVTNDWLGGHKFLAKGSGVAAVRFSSNQVESYWFAVDGRPYAELPDFTEPQNNNVTTAPYLGPLASTIIAPNLGTFASYTIHNTDNDGNAHSRDKVGYPNDVDYFKIKNPGTSGQGYLGFWVSVEDGSSVPIRLRLLDLNGNPILQHGQEVVSETSDDCSSYATLSIPVGTFIIEASSKSAGEYYLSAGNVKESPKALLDRYWAIVKIHLDPGDPINAILNKEAGKIFAFDRNVDLPIMKLTGEGTHLTIYDSEGNNIGEGKVAIDDTGMPNGEIVDLSVITPGQEYFAEVTRNSDALEGLALPFTLGLSPQ